MHAVLQCLLMLSSYFISQTHNITGKAVLAGNEMFVSKALPNNVKKINKKNKKIKRVKRYTTIKIKRVYVQYVRICIGICIIYIYMYRYIYNIYIYLYIYIYIYIYIYA